MKMKVNTKTTERASVEVPAKLLVRFLRSLGAKIPDTSRLNVYQSSFNADNTFGGDVHISWELDTHERDNYVDLTDEEDLEFIAGLAEGNTIPVPPPDEEYF
jgi:hypothetical protein